jgi:hypothetical protein
VLPLHVLAPECHLHVACMGGIYYDLCCIKCFVGQYTKYMKMYSMSNIQMTPCNLDEIGFSKAWFQMSVYIFNPT